MKIALPIASLAAWLLILGTSAAASLLAPSAWSRPAFIIGAIIGLLLLLFLARRLDSARKVSPPAED